MGGVQPTPFMAFVDRRAGRQWLVEASREVDALALVGDLADVITAVAHEDQTVVLSNYL